MQTRPTVESIRTDLSLTFLPSINRSPISPVVPARRGRAAFGWRIDRRPIRSCEGRGAAANHRCPPATMNHAAISVKG
jgi:hypothetical protein